MKNYESSTTEPLPEPEKDEKLESDNVQQSNESDEDSSVWDGSESEFVEDDDAEVFEEKYTGIKLNYELKSDEIFTCLKNFSEYKKNNKKIIVETVFLSIVFVGFLLSGIFKNDINGYIFSVISVLLIVIIWTVPNMIIKNHARELTKSGEYSVEIYPDEIVIINNDIERIIKLDGKSVFANEENLFIIIPPKGGILIIPVRAIEPDFLPDVEAMLMAGTLPSNIDE